MSGRALITGITGQDGSYLAEYLLYKGYEVHGLVRRCSRPVTDRIDHLLDRITLHEGDLLDQESLSSVVTAVDPTEVYNLAAMSFVGTSWKQPVLTAEVTGLGALRMLEAVHTHAAQDTRFYQASSSEMFGNSSMSQQDEQTPFAPCSPYGAAKVFAHNIAVNYRESYGMHVSCGILFNHESERRGLEFVTRKIARQVAEVAVGKRQAIVLGCLDAARDWGYAPDYVDAMWLMMQQAEPEDYVIATGTTHTVQDFAEIALSAAGLRGVPIATDPSFLRPRELCVLRGDPTKAYRQLEWEHTTTFREMVGYMVTAELQALGSDVPLSIF